MEAKTARERERRGGGVDFWIYVLEMVLLSSSSSFVVAFLRRRQLRDLVSGGGREGGRRRLQARREVSDRRRTKRSLSSPLFHYFTSLLAGREKRTQRVLNKYISVTTAWETTMEEEEEEREDLSMLESRRFPRKEEEKLELRIPFSPVLSPQNGLEKEGDPPPRSEFRRISRRIHRP